MPRIIHLVGDSTQLSLHVETREKRTDLESNARSAEGSLVRNPLLPPMFRRTEKLLRGSQRRGGLSEYTPHRESRRRFLGRKKGVMTHSPLRCAATSRMRKKATRNYDRVHGTI